MGKLSRAEKDEIRFRATEYQFNIRNIKKDIPKHLFVYKRVAHELKRAAKAYNKVEIAYERRLNAKNEVKYCFAKNELLKCIKNFDQQAEIINDCVSQVNEGYEFIKTSMSKLNKIIAASAARECDKFNRKIAIAMDRIHYLLDGVDLPDIE